MSTRTLSFLFTATLLTASQTRAQSSDPNARDDLAFFAGEWTCTLAVQPNNTTLHGKLSVQRWGAWYTTEWVSENPNQAAHEQGIDTRLSEFLAGGSGPSHPPAYPVPAPGVGEPVASSIALSGYDPVQKEYVGFKFMAAGRYSTVTSPGWEATSNTFTWSGASSDVAGNAVAVRAVDTAISNSEFTTVVSVSTDLGRAWRVLATSTCAKHVEP